MPKRTKTNRETRACSCCAVRFLGDLCPQCYVAGCAHKGKAKPCLMTSGTKATQEMTEHQVREAYAVLLAEYERLVASLPKPNGTAHLATGTLPASHPFFDQGGIPAHG